jgi:membrane-associated phospholipid phosphatase
MISLKALWLAALLAVLLIAAGMAWWDVPIAIFCSRLAGPFQPLGNHLGSTLLVSGETVVAAGLAAWRIITGRLPALGKVTVIACATSLAVFALNEVVLKNLFGVPNTYQLLFHDAGHGFHFFHGSWESSFPSGHMTLAGGFTATFVRQDRRLLAFLAAGTILAGGLLMAGNWHFFSDVVAGLLVGSAAGVTAATLWARHIAGVTPAG